MNAILSRLLRLDLLASTDNRPRVDVMAMRRRAMRQRREEPQDEFERRKANLLKAQLAKAKEMESHPLNQKITRLKGEA